MLWILSIVSANPARFPKGKIRPVLSSESKPVEKMAQTISRPDFNPAVTLRERDEPSLGIDAKGIRLSARALVPTATLVRRGR